MRRSLLAPERLWLSLLISPASSPLTNNYKVVQETKAEPTNYGDPSYWDKRYSKTLGQRYQWLESFATLWPYLKSCMPKGPDSQILNLGCGNGSIQEEIYENGYTWITNNDISPIVIEQMELSRKEKHYTNMKYEVMDVTNMTYPDQSFDLVFDKSMIDTLMCSDNPLLNVARLLQSSYRVLKQEGIYFAVCYGTPAFRLQHFARRHVGFSVETHTLTRTNEQGDIITNFLYIAKKRPMAKMTEEERNLFYEELAKIQEKEYPPLK